MGMNSCIFAGRFTRDPQIQRSKNGSTYVRFFLAINSRVYDKQQDAFVDKVDYLPFIAYEDIARHIAEKGCQGMKAVVEASAEQTMYRPSGSTETRKELIFRVKSVELDEGYRKKWSSPQWI